MFKIFLEFKFKSVIFIYTNKKCSTLKEADNITHVTQGRISNLCKLDDSKHQSKGYMFSRDKEIMEPYQASPNTNLKFLG